jgi:hypothetical protein
MFAGFWLRTCEGTYRLRYGDIRLRHFGAITAGAITRGAFRPSLSDRKNAAPKARPGKAETGFPSRTVGGTLRSLRLTKDESALAISTKRENALADFLDGQKVSKSPGSAAAKSA